MANSNNKKTTLLSAQKRLMLFVAGIATVVVAGLGVWHHFRVNAAFAPQAEVAEAPSQLHNTPGAGNPSDQYVAVQNAQNALTSAQAKEDQTSAVPTITRSNFVSDPNSFDSANDAANTAANTAPQSCPLSKVVYMYRPNPANCSVENLKLARESGVTATELRCQACGCPALRAAGYTVGDLRDSGLGADDLHRCGFALNDLMSAGFSATELKKAGFSAADLHNAGFSANQLAAAGFSPSELAAAGYTPNEIKTAMAALAASPLKPGSGACSVAALQKARQNGVSPAALKDQGCDLAAMRAAGFTATELKAAGFDAAALKSAGYSAADLKKAGFTAAQLKAAGVTAAELQQAGYSAADLKNAGFTAADLKAAGFTPAQLKDAGYSAAELKNAGFTAGDLRTAGYSAADLKQAGYSPAALRDAGYSAAELKQAGFTPAQLKTAGYTPGDLVRAGFSPDAAGYAPAPVATNASAQGSTQGLIQSSMPSINGQDPSQEVRRMQAAQQLMMSQQQRLDAVQQMQGQMMMQATKLMAGWSNAGTQTVQRAPDPTPAANGANGANANGAAGANIPTGPVIKAGTIMFAVLDSAINSDEANTPVMATIVSGDLKGAKLLGQFTRVDKRLLLNFNVINVPSFSKSFAANVVAIDPNTARTAMSGYVDNHYLLRYGSLFASSFLSGVAQGIQQQNTTSNCMGPFCVTTHGSMSPTDYVWMGLGKTGEQYASNMSSNFNRPPTVQIPGGVGMGLLFMSDVTLPEALPAKPAILGE